METQSRGIWYDANRKPDVSLGKEQTQSLSAIDRPDPVPSLAFVEEHCRCCATLAFPWATTQFRVVQRRPAVPQTRVPKCADHGVLSAPRMTPYEWRAVLALADRERRGVVIMGRTPSGAVLTTPDTTEGAGQRLSVSRPPHGRNSRSLAGISGGSPPGGLDEGGQVGGVISHGSAQLDERGRPARPAPTAQRFYTQSKDLRGLVFVD